jgi:hypothetical protein
VLKVNDLGHLVPTGEFRAVGDLVGPSGPPSDPITCEVVCLACQRSTWPAAGWRCSHCGEVCYYGWETGACSDCGDIANGRRKGHRFEALCDCRTSPQARAEWDDKCRRSDAEAERQAEQARQLRLHRESASDCWTRKLELCDVRMSRPQFNFCRHCPKFAKGQTKTR